MPQTTTEDLARIMVTLIEGLSATTEFAARYLEDEAVSDQALKASQATTELLATLRKKMVEEGYARVEGKEKS